MAHAAILDDLGDQLIFSLTGRSKRDPDFERLRDQVSKALRDRSYARTDQFAVENRYTGFFEKFQVLNRDAAAERLRACLDQLPRVWKWRPELLLLLAQLSNKVDGNSTLHSGDHENIFRTKPEASALTWDEIIADQPPEEPDLWEDIERGYHSSGDEIDSKYQDDSKSFSQTSDIDGKCDDFDALTRLHVPNSRDDVLQTLEALQSQHLAQLTSTSWSEVLIFRETLSMLQGLPTRVYRLNATLDKVQPRQDGRITTMSYSCLQNCMQDFAELGMTVRSIRLWLESKQNTTYHQACQAATQRHISKLISNIANIEARILTVTNSTVVSIIDLKRQIELLFKPFVCFNSVLKKVADHKDDSPFALLDIIYDETCVSELLGDCATFCVLQDILLAGLRAYLSSPYAWMTAGTLIDRDQTFFVVDQDASCSRGNLWHNRYRLKTFPTGQLYAPRFMRASAPAIFIKGKTRRFLREVNQSNYEASTARNNSIDQFSELRNSNPHELLPFSERLSDYLEHWIRETSKDASNALPTEILDKCDLLRTLSVIEHIFCSTNGYLFQNFATTLSRNLMGNSLDWNNSFILTKLAQTTLGASEAVDEESIKVTMTNLVDSNRPSDVTGSAIKHLNSLALEYALPWPAQNIVRHTTPMAHANIFRFLLQINHARYYLLSTTSTTKLLAPLARALPRELQMSIRLRYRLLCFTNILHTHITETSHARGTALRTALRGAGDIDVMVDAWTEYETRLERSLMVADGLTSIRKAVLEVLEICESFLDVWKLHIEPYTAHRSEIGTDADTALDARGQLAHNYPLTSVPDLVDKVENLLSLIIAGLRGVGSADRDSTLEALADQLDPKCRSRCHSAEMNERARRDERNF